MKFTCLDVISAVSKSGKPYTRGAFRAVGKNGPYLFLATCPPDSDYEPGEEYDANVAFSAGGNYVLPY